eukprot:TRINITY_DN4534_c0_g2_i1.p1 TRINITY_DN4534_c0_g2~~TRINITY_DN4534_c0_g2_i1.p1  ORF type:complete len:409 (-),score=75.54 TRINITY_DN4534_c0_g2_i1:237-1463(-)
MMHSSQRVALRLNRVISHLLPQQRGISKGCVGPSYVARSFSTSSPTDEILESKQGKVVTITLNRPQALNALNLNMIHLLTPKYLEWHKKPSEQVVVMKGAGGKAFCAGGDIVAIYNSGKELKEGKGDGAVTKSFFYEEYQLNHLIATLPSPQVSILNGITMGGGVGLSVHGKYRVATESTMFAMPETGIGFFCDVGGSHFLANCIPFDLGMYLALTGARLKGAEAYKANVATHFVPSDKISQLEKALSELKDVKDEHVQEVLSRFHVEPPSSTKYEVLQHKEFISSVFPGESVNAIFKSLESLSSEAGPKGEWAKHTLHTLKKMSPVSLRVVHEQLKRGKGLDIAECLKMEYRISQEFMNQSDFFEGVRALLVDKDKNPKWQVPSEDKSQIDAYFKKLSPDRELKLLV